MIMPPIVISHLWIPLILLQLLSNLSVWDHSYKGIFLSKLTISSVHFIIPQTKLLTRLIFSSPSHWNDSRHQVIWFFLNFLYLFCSHPRKENSSNRWMIDGFVLCFLCFRFFPHHFVRLFFVEDLEVFYVMLGLLNALFLVISMVFFSFYALSLLLIEWEIIDINLIQK